MERGDCVAKPGDQFRLLFDLRVGDLWPFALNQRKAGMIMQRMSVLNVSEAVFRCVPPSENRTHGVFCALAISEPAGAPIAGLVPDDQMTPSECVRLGFVVDRMTEGFFLRICYSVCR